MSDTDTQDDQGQDHQPPIQQLRQAAEDGKAARAEADALKRERLFLKAGITDYEDGDNVAALLFKTWEGGDDIEALKARATKLGIFKPTGPTPEELAAQQQRDAEDQTRRNAYDGFSATPGQAAGGTADQTAHPVDAAFEEFDLDRRSGRMTEKDAATDAVAKVLAAGFNGDKRVLFDREAHRRKAEAYDAARGRTS